ncbi:MAG: 4-hydroxy-tetrahydrodipicolinate reductase [Terriglobia bacterium]
MNIALVGYGKMGREVERVAVQRGHVICSRIDPSLQENNQPLISASSLGTSEVSIEFTHPGAVLDNIRSLAALKIPMVVGTTGWYQQLPQVEEWVRNAGVGLIYAPNFSLGVNLFYQIVAKAAGVFQPFAEYDVGLSEVHHRQKLDSPSGTAKKLIEILLRGLPRKKRAVTGSPQHPLQEDDLQVTSSRVGHVPGIHTVLFDSSADSIELTHTVRSREGFASGAIMAAEWIQGRKGLFTFEQALSDWLGNLDRE